MTDDEVVDGIRLLARTEGIFAETAGGVTVATLRKLVETGQLDPDAETVIFNTGDGLKTLDAIADRVGPAATIDPSYAAFTATGRDAGPTGGESLMSVTRPDPDDPAHLHRRRRRGDAPTAATRRAGRARRRSTRATPASGRASSTTGRAPPLRQHLRRRRGRALPRRTGDDRCRRRRRSRSSRRWPAAPDRSGARRRRFPAKGSWTRRPRPSQTSSHPRGRTTRYGGAATTRGKHVVRRLEGSSDRGYHGRLGPRQRTKTRVMPSS